MSSITLAPFRSHAWLSTSFDETFRPAGELSLYLQPSLVVRTSSAFLILLINNRIRKRTFPVAVLARVEIPMANRPMCLGIEV